LTWCKKWAWYPGPGGVWSPPAPAPAPSSLPSPPSSPPAKHQLIINISPYNHLKNLATKKVKIKLWRGYHSFLLQDRSPVRICIADSLGGLFAVLQRWRQRGLRTIVHFQGGVSAIYKNAKKIDKEKYIKCSRCRLRFAVIGWPYFYHHEFS
jgi:hypothetical protein